MKFFQQLLAHKGCLIRIKSQLFWRVSGCFDNNPGRVCLLIDAKSFSDGVARTRNSDTSITAILLIDGLPQWVWVDEKDIELINDTL